MPGRLETLSPVALVGSGVVRSSPFIGLAFVTGLGEREFYKPK